MISPLSDGVTGFTPVNFQPPGSLVDSGAGLDEARRDEPRDVSTLGPGSLTRKKPPSAPERPSHVLAEAVPEKTLPVSISGDGAVPQTHGTSNALETGGIVFSGASHNPVTIANLQEPAQPVSEKDFMGVFTDPRQYTPWTFCYAVHAISPNMEAIIKHGMRKKGTYQPEQDINLMEKPEKISKKDRIYCSIISPQHKNTWGRVMFILKFPFANILSTSSHDTGGHHMIDGAPPEDPGPTLTPQQMIEQNPESHNELVLSGKGVEISGIAVKILDVKGKSYYPEETAKMKEMARLINVPFIELHEESHVKDSPPHYEVNPIGIGILTVCRNEWKYEFLFYPEGGAPSCNKSIGRMCSEFTTPEEFAKLRPELAKALGNVIEGPEMLSRLDGHFRNIQALGGLHSAN